MVFANQGFLDVAIESWPEWQLNPRLLTSVLPQFQLFFSVKFLFGHCLRHSLHFFQSNSS